MTTNDILNLNNLLKPQISNESNLNNAFDKAFKFKKDSYTTNINSDFSNVFENAKKSASQCEKRKSHDVKNISDNEGRNFEKKSLNKTKNKNVDFNDDQNDGKKREDDIDKDDSTIVKGVELLNNNFENVHNNQEIDNVEKTPLEDEVNIVETCETNKDNINNIINKNDKNPINEEFIASNLSSVIQGTNENNNIVVNNESENIQDKDIMSNPYNVKANDIQNDLKQTFEFQNGIDNNYNNNDELISKEDIKLDDINEIISLNNKSKENLDLFNINEKKLNNAQVKTEDAQVNEVDIQNLEKEILNSNDNNFIDSNEVTINKSQVLSFEDEKMSQILSEKDVDLSELDITFENSNNNDSSNDSSQGENFSNKNNQTYTELFTQTSAKYNFENTNNINFNQNIKIDNISQINATDKLNQNINTNIINKDNILNQISNKLENLNDSQSRVNIVLRPENLGRLQLEIISDKNGAISANLTATNENVKQLLEKSINDLKNTLSSQGVNVSNINIKIENTNQTSNNGLNYSNQNNDGLNNNFNFNENSKNNFNGNNENQNSNYENKANNIKELNQKLNENLTNESQKSNDRLVDLKV